MGQKKRPGERDPLLPTNSVSKSYSAESPNFLHDVRPMTFAWHNVRVWREKPTRQVILDNINGYAQPHEVVALMGASGAGKTTLLNMLMERNLKGLDTSGETFVGGSTNVKIGDVSGYVQQEEMFMPTLTVYEHLMIQAGLRLVGLSKNQIKERIIEVMEELGLTKCQDSVIGLSGVKKGISGGEAKRLMVASVLLDNPSILFLDEPTTGLDSHMAQSLMNSLKKLAKDGRTILCTIHQPSSKIFNMLDVVIFLADGKLAYMGSPRDVLPFFDSLDLVCPNDYNAADYIIDMLAIDRQNGNEQAALDRIHRVYKAFMESPMTSDQYQKLCSYEGDQIGPIEPRKQSSFFTQVRLLLKRSLIDNKRNPALARAKFIQKLVMGLFVGLLYLQTQQTDVGITNLNGAMFYMVAEYTYGTLFGILTFLPNDFPLVVREHFDGLYNVKAYYIARVLSYMPIFILDGAGMLTIAYWMIGMVPKFQIYLVALGIGMLVEQSAASFGVMLSTVCPSYTVAISIAGPVLTVLSLTGGLFANVGEIPAFISWTQYISWFKYGFEALAINQWRGAGPDCIGTECRSMEEILGALSFSAGNFWIDIAAMFGFIALFYFVGYIGLYIRVHKNR